MSNLFTAVSAEQQEIIVGGARLRSRTTYNQDEKTIIRGLKITPTKYGIELKLPFFERVFSENTTSYLSLVG